MFCHWLPSLIQVQTGFVDVAFCLCVWQREWSRQRINFKSHDVKYTPLQERNNSHLAFITCQLLLLVVFLTPSQKTFITVKCMKYDILFIILLIHVCLYRHIYVHKYTQIITQLGCIYYQIMTAGVFMIL